MKVLKKYGNIKYITNERDFCKKIRKEREIGYG